MKSRTIDLNKLSEFKEKSLKKKIQKENAQPTKKIKTKMKTLNLRELENKGTERASYFRLKRLPKVKLRLFKKKKNGKKAKKKDFKSRKPFLISLGILVIMLGAVTTLFIYYIVLPVRRINNSVNKIQDNSYKLIDDFRDKDLTHLDERFDNIQIELQNIETEIDRLEFLKNYNYTQGYYNNLVILQEILDKTDSLIIKSRPELKETLEATGFKTDSQVEEGTGGDESAFSLIIKELPHYIEFYESIEPDILDIFADFKSMDVKYIPNLPDNDFRNKYEKVEYYINKYPEASENVKSFLKEIPDLIGAKQPVTYMLVMQNETEMRASGGLLTAVGTVTISQGEIGEVQNIKDMWDLELYISYTLGIDVGYRNIHGQNYLMNYGCGSTYLRAQDSGIYPDLHTSLNMFKDYYDTANQYDPITWPPYDHIIIVNHHAAESVLSLVQPLTVEGFGDVTADTLFDFIKAESDNALKYQEYFGDRKGVIGNIANATKAKLFDLPLTSAPRAADIFVGIVLAKDIGLYSKDLQKQSYFDKFGLSGRQAYDFNGDYFHLNEAQNCSLKLNRYVRNTVDIDIYIEGDGRVRKDVWVHWQQPQVYDDSLSKYYAPTARYSYRSWVRLFSAPGSYDFNSNGYENSGYLYYYPYEYYDETAQKQISDNVIQFDHRRFSESEDIPFKDLNISYRSPDSINYNDGGYKLLIQKHPGKSWSDGYERYDITVHHQGKSYGINFQMERDKVVTYLNGILQVDNYNKELDWILNYTKKIPFEKFSFKGNGN